MNINDLIATVKKKLKNNMIIENIIIEDKTFLHKKHTGFQEDKFHLKINQCCLPFTKYEAFLDL